MRSEIEQLRMQNQHSEKILAALVSNPKSEVVLEQLRSGETIETVLEKLDLEGHEGMATGKGKGRESEPVRTPLINSPNVTTFPRAGFGQPIIDALGPSRSIGSLPPFTAALNESYQSTPGSGDWPMWDDEAGTPVQSTNLRHDVYMKAPEPTSVPATDFPLIGTWHRQLTNETIPDEIVIQMREEGRSTMLGDTFGSEAQDYTRAWTEITTDVPLVEHLMALYFCWEYPTFASLSKEHFLDDFKLGRRRHCSSLLVNAMLAVGCRFSSLAVTRTNPDDSTTAGDHFFAEALRLLDEESDRHSLTTIQALGLMSIREASCGRSSEAIFYSGQSIRLAVEMGLHLDSENGGKDDASLEQAVHSATFWGAFSLDQFVNPP
jgi:hypothetical protein